MPAEPTSQADARAELARWVASKLSEGWMVFPALAYAVPLTDVRERFGSLAWGDWSLLYRDGPRRPGKGRRGRYTAAMVGASGELVVRAWEGRLL